MDVTHDVHSTSKLMGILSICAHNDLTRRLDFKVNGILLTS
jgi:hypothetical protein